MAQLNFDASQVAPDAGQMDAIPAGWYNVSMDQSEMKPTKDGSGAYLECRFNVLDGQHASRKLFSRLNLRNANPVAQEIAFKQLSAIAHAVGILQVQDSGQLHGHPMKVKVKLRAASGEYEASNEISAFKNINEVVSTATAAPAGFAPPAANFPPQQAPHAYPPQQAPAPMQAPQQAWAPPQQAAPMQAPQQAPAQQPWQQAPVQQPAAVVPAQQFAPQQQPAAAPQQAWQQPAAAQPWQQAPAQQPAPVQQAPAPMQAPQQAPQQAPAAQPWAGQQNPQTAFPPWAQPQA